MYSCPPCCQNVTVSSQTWQATECQFSAASKPQCSVYKKQTCSMIKTYRGVLASATLSSTLTRRATALRSANCNGQGLPEEGRARTRASPPASPNTSTFPRRRLRRTRTKKATPPGSATTKACRSSCRPATSWRAAAPARIIAIINNGIDIKHLILDSFLEFLLRFGCGTGNAFCTDTFLQTNNVTHRSLFTEQLLRADILTQRGLCTKKIVRRRF